MTYIDELTTKIKKLLEQDLHSSTQKLSYLREEAKSKIGLVAWERAYRKARSEVVKNINKE